MKNIKASNFFQSFASPEGSKDRLFINENLTKHRRLLVDSGNQRQRDGCKRSVGNTNPTRISSENDLGALSNEQIAGSKTGRVGRVRSYVGGFR